MDKIQDYGAVGMGRPIARRDFLNGVAIGITGAFAALNGISADAAPPSATMDAAQYPPLRTGLRGQYPAAVEEFERIRQGKYAQFPVADANIHEEYDVVIVGGGSRDYRQPIFIVPRSDHSRGF